MHFAYVCTLAFRADITFLVAARIYSARCVDVFC